jgi:hypothetical protein
MSDPKDEQLIQNYISNSLPALRKEAEQAVDQKKQAELLAEFRRCMSNIPRGAEGFEQQSKLRAEFRHRGLRNI